MLELNEMIMRYSPSKIDDGIENIVWWWWGWITLFPLTYLKEQTVLVIVVVVVNCRQCCCHLFLMLKWQHSCILSKMIRKVWRQKNYILSKKRRKDSKTKKRKKTPQKIESKPLNYQNKCKRFYRNISALFLEEIQPWYSTSTAFDHARNLQNL